MKEKHIALIQEPNLTSSSANEIKDHLKVIGCDGTATNTGANDGIFTLIEKNLGHSVQRVICLLHTNELIAFETFVNKVTWSDIESK